MSPTLSTLPLETVIQILKSVSDLKTLSAAVRSASHLHSAYLISREVIFTTVTLRELEKRGIDFGEPILFAEYKRRYNKYREWRVEFDAEIATGVEKLRRQIEANETPRLGIASCLLLASLRKFQRYRINDVLDHLGASGEQQLRDLQEQYLAKGSLPRNSSSGWFTATCEMRSSGKWVTGEIIEQREEYHMSPFTFFNHAKAFELLVKKV